MRHALIILVAAAGALTDAASAAEPREVRALEPASKWVLDYADERCVLGRTFGEGDDTVMLQIYSFGSWNDFHVLVIGKPVGRTSGPAAEGGYRLSGDPKDRDIRLLQGTAGPNGLPSVSFSAAFVPFGDFADEERMSDEQRRAHSAVVARPRPEYDATVDSMRVSFGDGAPVELHVGNMAEPLTALRGCVDDLYKSWGADPAAQKALSRRLWPRPSTVRRMQNFYPSAALMNGVSAYVPARVTVDSNGNATQCVVQSGATGKQFKDAVCEGLMAKYEPALDSTGKPVPSIFVTSVTYLIAN